MPLAFFPVCVYIYISQYCIAVSCAQDFQLARPKLKHHDIGDEVLPLILDCDIQTTVKATPIYNKIIIYMHDAIVAN